MEYRVPEFIGERRGKSIKLAEWQNGAVKRRENPVLFVFERSQGTKV
jgi:hypothetical protein